MPRCCVRDQEAFAADFPSWLNRQAWQSCLIRSRTSEREDLEVEDHVPVLRLLGVLLQIVRQQLLGEVGGLLPALAAGQLEDLRTRGGHDLPGVSGGRDKQAAAPRCEW
jgi:hypothetical protein